MRYAAIDLGTNTFDLLIVDCTNDSWEVCFQDKQWVRIGLDFYPDQVLTERAMQDAVDCLQGFKTVCSDFGVSQPKLIGTSALRDAINKAQFISRVRDELQWEVEVISGAVEASIVFKGTSSVPTCPNQGLIMDIGGGSTELIRFESEHMTQALSLNIGVTRLLAETNTSGTLEVNDIQRIYAQFDQALSVEFDQSVNLIGSSGPFETFYQLMYHKKLPVRSCLPLPMEALQDMLEALIMSTLEDRMILEQVPPFRKKYLHLAALQVKWVINAFNIKQVYASSAGLNEGIIELQKPSET
jgi:exopolyphosphatase / guanosine-5'-triphosphate,3'-diphosphate pyrophosphatase